MYLLNADEVNSALSNGTPANATAVSTGVRDVSRYSYPLGLVKTRCEELMEIKALEESSFTDTFEVTGRRTREHLLVLSNGFLTSDIAGFSLTFRDDYNTPVNGNYDIDHELGVVRTRLSPGRYRVSYRCGFKKDADGVFIDIPDWLKSIAKYALTSHYRKTSMANSTPSNVSFADIMQAIDKDLFTRVTKRYNRPRVDATFPIASVRNG